MRGARRRRETGTAVVDFVLVLLVLVPLFLGILQVALVLHVRNTLTSAASDGARYAATLERSDAEGVRRTRTQIQGALAARFAREVRATRATVDGIAVVRMEVHAQVPPLGIWGPPVELAVAAHAIEEVP